MTSISITAAKLCCDSDETSYAILTSSLQYQQAVETKEAANAFFKASDNDSAIVKWEEALSILEPVTFVFSTLSGTQHSC